MINVQNLKTVTVIAPVTGVKAGSFTSVQIDTVQAGVKYNYATIYLALGATDTALTVLKLQETDTTGTGYTDVPNGTFGAGTAPALPAGTDSNKIFAINVDLRGSRKRFLNLAATAGAGTNGVNAYAWCVLSRAGESPNTSAKRGLAAEVTLPIPA